MMIGIENFIEVTSDGQKVLVKKQHIVLITQSEDGCFLTLDLKNGSTSLLLSKKVSESYEQVKKLISEF